MEDNYNLSELIKPKSKRKNSKNKGHRFENDIAKMLNEKFNSKEFSRTPGSGAYATSHNLPEHLTIYGDLITPKKFKFCIECKRGYSDMKFDALIDCNADIWKFIEQAEKDAKKADKDFLLIWKPDRRAATAFFPARKEYIPYLAKKPHGFLKYKYYCCFLDDLLTFPTNMFMDD